MLREKLDQTLQKCSLVRLSPSISKEALKRIHFEIGSGEVYQEGKKKNLCVDCNYMERALNRTKKIFRETMSNADLLVWQVDGKNRKQMHSAIRKFGRRIYRKTPQECYEMEYSEKGECFKKQVLLWDLKNSKFPMNVLWKEIIKADFAGFQELISAVYVVNSFEQRIFHLYDDRGLDIIFPSHAFLFPIAEKYRDWILEMKIE